MKNSTSLVQKVHLVRGVENQTTLTLCPKLQGCAPCAIMHAVLGDSEMRDLWWRDDALFPEIKRLSHEVYMMHDPKLKESTLSQKCTMGVSSLLKKM